MVIVDETGHCRRNPIAEKLAFLKLARTCSSRLKPVARCVPVWVKEEEFDHFLEFTNHFLTPVFHDVMHWSAGACGLATTLPRRGTDAALRCVLSGFEHNDSSRRHYSY